MIKVLEHGIRKITCPSCKAKLQYEQEDIIIEKHPNGDKYIICPDCNQKIIISKHDTFKHNTFKDTFSNVDLFEL